MKFKPIIIILSLLAAVLSSCEKERIIGYQGEKIVYDTLIVSSNFTDDLISIETFGVKTTNPASVNTTNMQLAINWAASRGRALYVPATDKGYPMNGGLILKKNVSLIGTHSPTAGNGTVSEKKDHPVGSTFVITDTENAFMYLESATQISGIQFYYPNQGYKKAEDIIEYPPTLKLSQTSGPQGVTLTDLSFYGEYTTMDFLSVSTRPCEQILIQNCYGFPLSGIFVQLNYCYDIPRVLHSHIHMNNQEAFGKTYGKSVLDKIANSNNYAYWFNNIDNLVLMDISTDCSCGGVYLGGNTYGQLTQFSFTNVQCGIWRTSNSSFNRTWLIADGVIAPNVASKVDDVHGMIIMGVKSFTSLVNVSTYAATTDRLTNLGTYKDFAYIGGSSKLTVAMTGCSMEGFAGSQPITVDNSSAQYRMTNCNVNGSIVSANYPQ